MTMIRDCLRILRFRVGVGRRPRRDVHPRHPDGSLRQAQRQAEPVLILQDAIHSKFNS